MSESYCTWVGRRVKFLYLFFFLLQHTLKQLLVTTDAPLLTDYSAKILWKYMCLFLEGKFKYTPRPFDTGPESKPAMTLGYYRNYLTHSSHWHKLISLLTLKNQYILQKDYRKSEPPPSMLALLRIFIRSRYILHEPLWVTWDANHPPEVVCRMLLPNHSSGRTFYSWIAI